jgi:hypothetical protein
MLDNWGASTVMRSIKKALKELGYQKLSYSDQSKLWSYIKINSQRDEKE